MSESRELEEDAGTKTDARMEESEWEGAGEADQAEETERVEEMSDDIPAEEYQYGNMQKNVPSGDFMRYKDKIIFFYYNDQNHTFCLYEMEPETGENFVRMPLVRMIPGNVFRGEPLPIWSSMGESCTPCPAGGRLWN